MTSRGHALARDALVRTLTAYSGITTEDGAGDGSTLVDSNLIDNPFISPSGIPEKTVLILSGDARGEDKGSASFNNGTGAVTLQGTGFSAQIMAGTIYRILNISTTEIDVATISANLGAMADAATSDDLSDITTTSALAKVRRLLLRFSSDAFSVSLDGSARTDLETLFTALGVLLGTRAEAAATGAVGTTKSELSYIKQLVTELQALDVVADTTLANVMSILVDYLAHGTWGLTAIRAALQLVQTDTYNIHNNVLSVINDYLGHGTWGLAPIRAALQLVQTDVDNIDNNVLAVLNDYLSKMRSNLVRWGQISAVAGNTFTSAALAGLGIDAMPGWWVYVMQADDAAPEGEYRMMTDYTDAGVVSHEAFSTALEIGDRVQLIHPLLYEAKAMRGGAETLESLDDELDAILDVARGTSGAVSVDGGEDDLYDESSDNEFVLLELRVDLNNLAEGDSIIFKVYTTEGGTERKISDDAANTFTGVQDPARVEIIGSANQVWGREGIRVCAVKSAGTTRAVTAYYRDAKRGA